MHTYVKHIDPATDAEIWTVGYFAILKTNGTQTFMPLFDVASQVDARVAVTTLNGSGPVQTITMTHEYTEGLNPTLPDDPFVRLKREPTTDKP